VAVVLTIVSGNNTIAAQGETFDIVVRATDGDIPQVGIVIGWPVLTGDATTATPFSTTVADGLATMTVTAGSLTSTIGPYAPALPSAITFTVYGQINFNCSCDDDYPSKTLAQMRAYLAVRLGMAEQVQSLMPGVTLELNSYLSDAQEQIYRKYKVFRMERYFTWDMTPSVRFYDFADNLYGCTKKLDPRMVTWVGISQDSNFWRPLVAGIRPELYYGDIESIPTHYEIRQCIEVWPPPGDTDWQLRIRGYFGLAPLVDDTDVSTIDYELIQLYALANAKAHRGQPDAANYMQQFKDMIRNFTAGTHGTRRYVPGQRQSVTPPLPILTGYPGDP